MQQTILELANPFDAYVRKAGPCLVLFLITATYSTSSHFIVKLYSTGELRTVDQQDLRVFGDQEYLNNNIPEDWK